MLQPLGISAEAEAVYLVLAPIGSATSVELAELTSLSVPELERRLDELAQAGPGHRAVRASMWRTLPLPDVVNALKAQRLSELEMASLAAESLHSHLLAATQSQTDDIRIVVGREAIVASNRELCNRAQKEICMFDKPPYAEERDAQRGDPRGGRPGVAGAGARHPAAQRLPPGLRHRPAQGAAASSPPRASSRGPVRCR